jgi:putative ABC transport system ATP-binding protein/lipoprotein-releasing system ATP-binding protein
MFFIKKLECKYENTTVFSAENIDIPKGKLTVILGPSGSGKSTFIEALGLMNKTMTDNSEVYFYPENIDNYKSVKTRENRINLNELWKRDFWGRNRKTREEIRYNDYSFVFQDTYLMPNFSAIDNIALTDLIKKTKLHNSYYKIIKGLIVSLKLQNLFFNNKPSSYSGGERQRMAFGRGIFPDFKMLFGDEPTGNLDPHNATEVLKYAKENIGNGKSALLVTHSIDLALQFADKILVLTPKEKVNSKKKFTVLPEFTFHRKDWSIKDEESKASSKKRFEKFRQKIDFLIASDNGDLVLELSDKIIGTSDDEKEKIFQEYIKNAESIDEDKHNEEDLIKKVVAEISSKTTRDAVIKAFSVNDKIEINYLEQVEKAKQKEEEEKRNSPPIPLYKRIWKPILNALASPIQKVTLGLFRTLIKGQLWFLKLIWKNLGKLSNDFLDIFVHNELREFLGRVFPRNFVFVLFIQFLIFYLIGTANGILDFVAQQDKNPFVKVINISSSYDGIEASMNKVESEINLKLYGIDTITYFKQETNHFNPVNQNPDSFSVAEHFAKDNFQLISVKSMQPGDPMRNYILNNSELNPFGTDFSGNDDISVIVTRNFLKRLGQKDSTFIVRSINNADEKCWQPLPIRGLVDQLPGDADMVCLDNLWASIMNDQNWSLLTDKFALWIKMDSTLLKDKFDPILIGQLKKVANRQGVTIETDPIFDDILFISIDNKSIENIRNIDDLFELKVGAPGITRGKAEEVFSELMKQDSIINFLKENNISLDRIQLSHLNTLGSGGNIDYNDANIYVNSFRRIYEFSEKVYDLSGLRLDMAKIERIRNYRIVASVTSLLSIFLIIFSILIIIILLSNILSNHLNKIRKNIGLLMAFGVSTKIIYQCIMFTFIVVTLIGGAFLSYIVGGYFGFNKWLFEGATGFVLPNFSGFKISWAYISDSTEFLKCITNPTIITIALMLLFNLIRFNFIINKIFKETPGNLIYDKSNKG